MNGLTVYNHKTFAILHVVTFSEQNNFEKLTCEKFGNVVEILRFVEGQFEFPQSLNLSFADDPCGFGIVFSLKVHIYKEQIY